MCGVGLSSKSWPTMELSAHMIRTRSFSQKPFSNTFLALLVPIPAPLSNRTPKLSSRAFCQAPLTSPHGCREAMVYGSN